MRYPYQPGNIMNVVQNLMTRLRPFVGPKGWDYCVLWKLSEDQRYIELMDCCCAGTTEGTQNGGELHFPVSPVLSCRDVMFQHPRTKSCELLAELPSSMPLHPGNIHAQTLISNLPRWLNLDSSVVPGEMVGTNALIPVPGGLMELFIAKQVPEDQHVIDVVTSQCNFLMEQEAMINPTNMDSSGFSIDMNVISENQSKPFLADAHEQKDDINCSYQPPAAISSQTTVDNLNLPYDIFLDRLRMSSSPINVLQEFNYSANEETKTKNEVFLGTDALKKSIMRNSESMQMQYVESALTSEDQQGNDKESMKLENGPPADSHSECNDQIDDEDDVNYRRRNGKGPQSKNLVAERKRRRKLNDRLYALRSLVPKISKLDRASILGDAIEFIKELKKQEKELQDELDEHSDNEDENQNGVNLAACNSEISLNGFHMEGSSGINFSKLNQDSETTHHNKAHQMEPQVEVSQIDGNKFFVEVFCERKPGGFVKLVGFLDSLGLEVTNTNVTSNTGLVFYVLKAKRKEDNEMVQADYVRDSLLEFTRDPPSGGWPEMPNDSEDHTAMDYSHHYHHHHLHNGHINSNHHHLHHFHN